LVKFWGDILRDEISQETGLLENDYPFAPHLTTNLNRYEGEIDALYLCSKGYKIHETWGL
ncbi:hypothetical protein, partial [Salmonella enterica]|uniref:hypothetical protein n=1 Tax=Salmonella enterica TaxID=28901 RepID=UPI003CF36F18